MDVLSDTELNNLGLNLLVSRMDEILCSSFMARMGNAIMKLDVRGLYESKCVQNFPENFQRKIVYKIFGMMLQLFYTEESSCAHFHKIQEDYEAINQLHSAAKIQWFTVSSRMVFEYFMHILYMLGKGKGFKVSKSATKTFKRWLKEPDNPYTYFSISAARAFKFDRLKRTPEVHAGSKLTRKVLMLTADEIDNDRLSLILIIRNQWQFVIEIANGISPEGWVSSGNVEGDEEWYKIFSSGDQEHINKEVEKMFQFPVPFPVPGLA